MKNPRLIHFKPTADGTEGLLKREIKSVSSIDVSETIPGIQDTSVFAAGRRGCLAFRQRAPRSTLHWCFKSASSLIQPQVPVLLKLQIDRGLMKQSSEDSMEDERGVEKEPLNNMLSNKKPRTSEDKKQRSIRFLDRRIEEGIEQTNEDTLFAVEVMTMKRNFEKGLKNSSRNQA